MRCEAVEVRLDALRSDELERTERDAVEDHLEDCVECRVLEREIGDLAGKAADLKGECEPCCLETIEEKLFDRYARFDAPQGTVHVAWSSDGIRRIRLGGSRDEFEKEYRKRLGRDLHCSALDQGTREAIEEALRGQGEGDVNVDLSGMTDFERRVLTILREIPAGEVRTYAWVAKEAGRPSASRAVGNTCAKNPIPFVVPCHRVVPSSGGVGSYGYGPAMKRSLLRAEGVAVDYLDELARRGIRYVGSMRDRSYCVPSCRGVTDIEDGDRLMLRDERQAAERGLRPCEWCRPLARSA